MKQEGYVPRNRDWFAFNNALIALPASPKTKASGLWTSLRAASLHESLLNKSLNEEWITTAPSGIRNDELKLAAARFIHSD